MATDHLQTFRITNTDVFVRFTDWLKSVLNEKNGTISIALSGGNTPKALFDFWVAQHKNDIDWNKIKFFWGDERCVLPNDEQSNYKMTKEHLFDFLPIPEKNIFRIKGEDDSELEAKRYSEILQNELDSVGGVPSFDIVMLGMGDDGHTASIFPNRIDLWESPEICLVASHPQSGQKRVSLSGKTINAAQNVAFLVTGKNKAEKVKAIIENHTEAKKVYPAAKVAPISGNLLWFLDEEAANLLM